MCVGVDDSPKSTLIDEDILRARFRKRANEFYSLSKSEQQRLNEAAGDSNPNVINSTCTRHDWLFFLGYLIGLFIITYYYL
jgi:hypothetical protein